MRNDEVLANVSLNSQSIDTISEIVAQKSAELGADPKSVLRVRLSAEDVMRVWAEQLGENTPSKLIAEKHLFKTYLAIYADGKSIDPTQYKDELLLSVSNNPNMVSVLGLIGEYRYTKGSNKLVLYSPKKKSSSLRPILFAIVAALILGSLSHLLIPEISKTINQFLLQPLLSTILKLVKLIASPLVFLSIVCGITGMGDLSSFGKIGKQLIKRIVLITFSIATVCCLILSLVFPFFLTTEADLGDSISSLIAMILDIIPGDLVSPLQTGNIMQIIFIAICFGIGLLVLSEESAVSINILNQLNSIIQLLMTGITKILPALIFLCITNIIIESDAQTIIHVSLPLVTCIVLDVCLPIFFSCYASFKAKIPFKKLIKTQLPCYLTALSTASSAAAFHSNIECCEKLGIDPKIVKFAIPFGQVLYMPGSLIDILTVTMFALNYYHIDMSYIEIISMILILSIIAIASSPTPGTTITGATIMFTSLMLPMEAIALVTTVLLLADYFSTACNVICLQNELLIEAANTGKVNLDSLKHLSSESY